MPDLLLLHQTLMSVSIKFLTKIKDLKFLLQFITYMQLNVIWSMRNGHEIIFKNQFLQKVMSDLLLVDSRGPFY